MYYKGILIKMLFEIIIILEAVAFIFLALGLYPNKQENQKTAFLNKMIYIFVSAIIFFALGVWTVSYDYNYCYINETITDFDLNSTLSTGTCASYNIQSIDLSYLNWGMGIISVVLFIILIIFAGMSKYDNPPEDEFKF